MDPVGVAIGAVGLISLFSTCIEGFQLVENGKYLGKDYDLLETKFSNQRLRLRAWGQACGLMDSEGQGYDSRLDEAELRPNIERTLNHIMITLQSEKLLTRKYGLKQDSAGGNRRLVADQAVGPITRMHLNATIWKDKFREFKARIDSTQEQASLIAKVRWAIGDRKKFVGLVLDFKGLIDDLEVLTAIAGFSDIAKRQREFIGRIVASINDIETLRSMEAAYEGQVDAVSNAATFRLSQLQQQSLLEGSATVSSESCTVEADDRCVSIPDLHEWSLLDNQLEWMTDCQGVIHHLLHRVKCHETSSVRHFFDSPTAVSNIADQSEWTSVGPPLPQPVDSEERLVKTEHPHLCGKRPLRDLESYLQQNSNLSFIIFQNYECCTKIDEPELTQHVKHSVRLLSDDLCASLASLPQGHLPPSLQPIFAVDHELQGPFIWLYYSRRSWKVLEDEPQYISLDALILLLDCLRDCMADEYAHVDALLREACISLPYLNYIFHPGTFLLEDEDLDEYDDDIVDRPTKRELRAYRQVSAPRVIHIDSTKFEARVRMSIESLEFRDGFLCVTWGRCLNLSSNGKLKIKRLPLYPLQFAGDGVKNQLIKRGIIFSSCQTLKYVSYDGRMLELEAKLLCNKFIVDVPALVKLELLRRKYVLQATETRIEDWVKREDFLMLLPPTYPAYSLFYAKKVKLNVLQIREVEWMQSPIFALDMKYGIKELLLSALPDATLSIRGQSSRRERTGSRILLCGRAGTGKRYIVDVLAEAAKRPLCRVDTTQLSGAQPHVFELYDAFFEAWDCMVHITGAEVLTERVINNKHKSLMTFVQKFKGTLFLSANTDNWDGLLVEPLMDLRISSELVSRVHRIKVWLEEMTNRDVAIGSDKYDPLRFASCMEWFDSPENGISEDESSRVEEIAAFPLTDDQIYKFMGRAERIALTSGQIYIDLELILNLLKMSKGKDAEW